MSLVFLAGQARFMSEHGLRVHAISSAGPELDRFTASEGIPTTPVHMQRRLAPLADLRALVRIYVLIRRLKPRIVHAHTPKAGLLGMLASTAAGTELRIYHMRGLPLLSRPAAQRRILTLIERLTCALAHAVICVSHSLRDAAIANRICPPPKVTVLLAGSGNGVDAAGRFDPDRLPRETRATVRAELGIPRDALVIGFIGRVVSDKGIVELWSAWETIREDFPNARLVIIGPFEREDPIPAHVEERMNADARVRLHGTDWDTPRLYAAMDVVALPTYREGLPNVPLEAGSMGLPVVATRVAGCVDVVADGKTGTLIEPRDAAALAAALRRYLADGELRQRHGAAARARMLSEFRRERIWEAVRELYLARLT